MEDWSFFFFFKSICYGLRTSIVSITVSLTVWSHSRRDSQWEIPQIRLDDDMSVGACFDVKRCRRAQTTVGGTAP